MNTKFKVANAIGFQILWWSLVLLGDVAVLLALPVVVLHFVFLRRLSEYDSDTLQSEIKMVASVVVIGIALDLVLASLNFFEFSKGKFFPWWLIALWICFACTSRHSLKWFFTSKPGLFILAVFGLPMSYIAAEGLGAVKLQSLTFFSGPNYFVFLAHGVLFVFLFKVTTKTLAVNFNHAIKN